MACTTSIGPGATNMVTAAARGACQPRCRCCCCPATSSPTARPDPVLQQVEDFGDGTVSANDCFRPVSRYFDRITRPEQIIAALPRAMAVLTDPAECGPVTLALCQDVQAEAYRLSGGVLRRRACVDAAARSRPDARRTGARGRAICKRRKKPLIVAGGGVRLFRARAGAGGISPSEHGIPVAETQAGKSRCRHDHQLNMGSIGVTGTRAANALAAASRRGARRRHAAAGFHHRLRAPVQRPGAQDHRPQRAAVRCRQASRACRWSTDARAGIAAVDKALGDWSAPARVAGNGRGGAQDLDRQACRGDRCDQCGAAVRRRR
mgnify:CR=1 FL=1